MQRRRVHRAVMLQRLERAAAIIAGKEGRWAAWGRLQALTGTVLPGQARACEGAGSWPHPAAALRAGPSVLRNPFPP